MEAEANTVDLDAILYIKVPVPEFRNAPTWTRVAVANPWTPYAVVSQLVEDGSIFKDQIFSLKGEVIHSVKTFSIKSHQQYHI